MEARPMLIAVEPAPRAASAETAIPGAIALPEFAAGTCVLVRALAVWTELKTGLRPMWIAAAEAAQGAASAKVAIPGAIALREFAAGTCVLVRPALIAVRTVLKTVLRPMWIAGAEAAPRAPSARV